MTPLVSVAVILGSLAALAATAAIWDGTRRALASQVRLAELRVESMRRADYEAMGERVAVGEAAVLERMDEIEALVQERTGGVEAQIAEVKRTVDGVGKAMVLGGAGRGAGRRR